MNIKAAGIATLCIVLLGLFAWFVTWLAENGLFLKVVVFVVIAIAIGYIWHFIYEYFATPEGKPEE
jgi:hypothetical protein